MEGVGWASSGGFSAVAGSARRQCEARSVGGAVHRVGGSAVRSGIVLGYGGLWAVEGRAVAALPSPGAWHPEPRTFSRVFRLLKPETFEPSHSAASWPPLPRPMVSTSQAWWQSTARPCAAPTNAAGPPRRCRWSMSLRWMPAWPWLSRKRLVATRRLVPWKCWTFCPSKVALSPPTRCIATARLRPRCASEAATMFWRSRRTAALVHGGCATVRALRQAQPRQARRPVQSRSTRNAPCHCHAQHQLGYPLWFSGRRCGGRVTLRRRLRGRRADAPVVRHYLLSKYISPKRLLHITRSHWGIENRLHWVKWTLDFGPA